MAETLLITGATGNTGQVVVSKLQQRGVPFVAMVRSVRSASHLQALGVKTIEGDFDDPPSLARALRGVEKAYLVCTPDHRIVRREQAFIEAAQRSGVKHIVRCSAYLSDVDAPSANLRAHGLIDRTLSDANLEHTIIRPIGFMQTFTLFMWDNVMKAGALSLPTGDGGMPLIDVRDVAELAVRALTMPGFSNQCYDITGPESLSSADIAAVMTHVLKRPVRFIPGDEQQTRWIMKLLGVPEIAAEHVLEVFQMQRKHQTERVFSTLEDLDIVPTTYEQFLKDFVGGRTGGGNSFQPPVSLSAKFFQFLLPWSLKLRMKFMPPTS